MVRRWLNVCVLVCSSRKRNERGTHTYAAVSR